MRSCRSSITNSRSNLCTRPETLQFNLGPLGLLGADARVLGFGRSPVEGAPIYLVQLLVLEWPLGEGKGLAMPYPELPLCYYGVVMEGLSKPESV